MITPLNTLFDIQPAAAPGFYYFPGFISVEEEKELINEIEKTALHSLIFQGYEAKRKFASYGYDWDFKHRKLSKGKPIPGGFIHLIKKVADHLSLKEEDILNKKFWQGRRSTVFLPSQNRKVWGR